MQPNNNDTNDTDDTDDSEPTVGESMGWDYIDDSDDSNSSGESLGQDLDEQDAEELADEYGISIEDAERIIEDSDSDGGVIDVADEGEFFADMGPDPVTEESEESVESEESESEESEESEESVESPIPGKWITEEDSDNTEIDEEVLNKSVIDDPDPIGTDLSSYEWESKKYVTEEDHNPNFDRTSLESLIQRLKNPKKTDIVTRGRILEIKSEEDYNGLDLIIASTSLCARVRVWPDFYSEIDDLRPGDVIEIEDPGNGYGKITVGAQTDITVISRLKEPLEDLVDIRNEIELAALDFVGEYPNDQEVIANVAEAIRENRDIITVTLDDDTQTTWVCDGDTVVWSPLGETDVISDLIDYIPDTANRSSIRSEIKKQVVNHPDVTTEENHFRLGPPDDVDLSWCVPTTNGLVDLREPPTEDNLIEHKPEHYTHRDELIDAEFDPDAECPEIEEALSKVAGGDQYKIDTFYEILSAVLMRNNDFQRLIVKIGESDTGKSTLDKLIKALCGEDSAPNAAIHDLATGDFAMSSVERSYAVIDDDVNSEELTKAQCAVVKKLVGDGGVRSGAKFVEEVSHDPYATLLANANTPFMFSEWSEAIQNRLLPIFFDQLFVRYPSGPNQHKEIQSSELEDKITTEEELSGLLNKIIEAANRLIAHDGLFTIEREVGEDELMEKYMEYADNTERFLRNNTRQTQGEHRVSKDDWMELYSRWCDDQNISPQPRQKFFDQVRESTERYVDFGRSDGVRYTKTMIPTQECLREYAPEPLAQKYSDWGGKPGANNVDTVQPVDTMTTGSVTVQGEVASKINYDDDLAMMLQCENGRCLVIGDRDEILEIDSRSDAESEPWDGCLDGIIEGDTVRVEYGYVQYVDGSYAVRVFGGETQLKLVDRNDQGRVGMGQTVIALDVIDGLVEDSDEDAVRIDDVIDEFEQRGIEESVAMYQINKLKNQGDIYEPVPDALRTT